MKHKQRAYQRDTDKTFFLNPGETPRKNMRKYKKTHPKYANFGVSALGCNRISLHIIVFQ